MLLRLFCSEGLAAPHIGKQRDVGEARSPRAAAVRKDRRELTVTRVYILILMHAVAICLATSSD